MLKEDAQRIEQTLTQQELAAVLKQYVTKIYAHMDGSCSVNVGVHITSCGGPCSLVCTTFLFRRAA